MEAARNRITVGGVLSESFRIYGQNLAVLLASAAVVFLIVGILQGLLQGTGSFILVIVGWIISLIGVTLYTGFVVRLVEDVRDGRRDYSVGDLFRSVESVLAPLILNSILRSIAVGIGLVLLIIPGLILLTIWAVTAPAIVIERRGAIEAFPRSQELVRGQAWTVFGVLVVVFLLLIVVSAIIGAIAAGAGTVGGILAAVIGNLLVAPAFALVAAVMFFDLRGPAPAPGVPETGSPSAPPPEPPAA